MRIVIAGAGEVGRHLAAVLAADNHEITLVDRDSARLETVAENLDVRTLVGSATRADTLRTGGTDQADLFVSATDADEINLLAASIAKGLGCRTVLARVHHSAYHGGLGIDYARVLNIDQLICPEYLTSLAIAGVLRDPAIQAIEHFARGQLVMERVEVSERAEVLAKPLKSLGLPPGFRIGTVTQLGHTRVPDGETVLQPGDQVTLVGNTGVMEKVLPRFRSGALSARRVVILGGSAISVWLARALKSRAFKVRIYVQERPRAEELAEKLPHATILKADPADPDVFAEENIAEADAFVAASIDDEHNVLSTLQAKHLGVATTIAVINQPTYHQLIETLGIYRVFSPRVVAAREIQRMTQRTAVQQIARLDEHGTAVYEIQVGRNAPATGRTLLTLELPPGCVLIAVQRNGDAHVPGPRDTLEAGDSVIAITSESLRRKLSRLFS